MSQDQASPSQDQASPSQDQASPSQDQESPNKDQGEQTLEIERPLTLFFILRKLCCMCCEIFCCPPSPLRIAEKIALPGQPWPMPGSSYKMIPDESGEKFKIQMNNEFAMWIYPENQKDRLEVFYTTTRRGNRIACMMCHCSTSDTSFTILFSHANCVDIGQMSSFCLSFGTRINCNIFHYDYSGYGESSGEPLEKNLYADAEAAYEYLTTEIGILPENIILYGQSIGTVATVHLASMHEVGGVILHGTLMSAMTVCFNRTESSWCCDNFASIDKAPRIRSPVLMVHGTKDELCNISHAHAFYNKCPIVVEPLWDKDARHLDIDVGRAEHLYARVKYFIAVELLGTQIGE